MKGYERNYDFGDLLDCASGLNRLAALEYGEKAVKISKGHVKQRTLWAKLHPLPPDQTKPDLADFGGLETDEKICSALQVGLLQAQSLLTQLNMSPHAGVRDKTWWKSPWTLEKELGLFGRPSNTEELEDECRDIHDMENPGELSEKGLSTDLWDIPQADEVPSGHQMYKASLVSLLVGNPTFSKDRLTRIKQSVYFNGVKPKPRVEGVPVCIMDVGSGCGVLFDTPDGLISSRSCRGRQSQKQRRDGQAKQVWFGRVQKIRRKYNGKWAKSRSEIDLLDRPVAQAGEGCCCQVLFNWYTPVAGSKIKFTYDNTDLQWIDLESVITVVSMKMERTIRVLWTLDNNDRARINEFIAGL
ncbi:hypothetical protein R1sor_006175 [Riccia sorocarpa]|uniref:Uncharacterized protein n=1 Tax=Riccia sorocarpa TaxID=122646 RepID=A0ABD3HT66_9MARC